MRLHQLKIEFRPEEDRLLMRLATNTAAEVLLWLTRRCVKRLWPVLLNMAQAAPEVVLQPNPEARKALVGFQHEKAIRQANFSTPYAETPRERPLGADPLLVARIQPRRDPQGRHVLGLLPATGQGVHVTLDDGLLHGLMKLLQNAVAKSDWELDLTVPAVLAQPADAASGRPTIN
ncbi:MAG: hypothetical protein IT515_18945 [Burkholderiales bacterium]|nr:hypothetical protein [Burkholderiales bacterium]